MHGCEQFLARNRVSGETFESRPAAERMKYIPSIVVLMLLVCGCLVVRADNPHVILMMADDMGWGDTGYNGNRVIKTPNLDQMSREGIRFDRFYAGSSVCSPTRGSRPSPSPNPHLHLPSSDLARKPLIVLSLRRCVRLGTGLPLTR